MGEITKRTWKRILPNLVEISSIIAERNSIIRKIDNKYLSIWAVRIPTNRVISTGTRNGKNGLGGNGSNNKRNSSIININTKENGHDNKNINKNKALVNKELRKNRSSNGTFTQMIH